MCLVNFVADCDILTAISLGFRVVDLIELVVAFVLELPIGVVPFILFTNKLTERKMLLCLFTPLDFFIIQA